MAMDSTSGIPHLSTPIIYNLFPTLAGPIDRWQPHAERAASMAFNWLYVNPVHEPGFSGSLYAIKHYDRLNPMLVPHGQGPAPLSMLRPVIETIKACGLRFMIDLVINHTAIDSPLVTEHPSWYLRDETGRIQHPYAIDPDDPEKKIIWGDLAEIDNASSPDRDQLWEYWAQLIETYLDLGVDGFRCDAAYKVPAPLWHLLITRARRRHPQTVFWAENLGCTLEQTRALRTAGFQFFCNSSKWWNFYDPWCLEQHREFEDLPSISFPETHDTDRLAAESGGSEAVQRQRYAFAAMFSAGLMMPIGYEYGFRRRLHVVETRPSDWEPVTFDLTAFIAEVNRLKLRMPLLQGEGHLRAIEPESHASPILVLERRSLTEETDRGAIVINRDVHEMQSCRLAHWPLNRHSGVRYRVSRLDRDPHAQALDEPLRLDPAEVDLIVAQ